MSYENLIKLSKKETNEDTLRNDLNKVEAFLDKCLAFFLETTGALAERDYNVTSL